jgi:hypothetical protein
MIQPLRCLVVLAVATVVACGAPAPASTARHLVLDEQDTGRTLTVHRGDTVELVLFEPRDAAGASDPWTATSSEPSVLRLTSTDRHGPSTGSYYIADFVAERSGAARLAASRSIGCTIAEPPCRPLTFSVVVRY